jgi:hypothetical protein
MQQGFVDLMQQQQWQQDCVDPRNQPPQQQHFRGGPPFGSGPPFRGASGPPGGAGTRGPQDLRGPPTFRQELPPEPTEPAYKTRVWHKSLEESVSTSFAVRSHLQLLHRSGCVGASLHVVLYCTAACAEPLVAVCRRSQMA